MTKPPLLDARLSLGAAVLDDLFPEGPAFRRSVQSFAILLILAALIASFGLYQDSVAAIIGAMVVAPLGGAIMAIAAALVTGRTRWQSITIIQVALGSIGVVAIGALVSAGMPDPLVLTPSIDARTQPGLLDLGVALAAGAAGAYVAVRRTGSDALPGVAIAVSLVPPLATIGICIELGRWDDAGGATILFLTNLAAIVVAASIVFIAFRATPTPTQLRERRRLRNGFILAMIALALITIPLVWRSAESVTETFRATEASQIVRGWIGDRDLDVTSYDIEGTTVRIDLAGPDEPAPAAELAADLAAAWETRVDLNVVWTPSRLDRAASP